MTRPVPLFVCERSAAQLLDMKPSEFRKLVDDGFLPGPRNVGILERWDTNELRHIISGDSSIEGRMEWP